MNYYIFKIFLYDVEPQIWRRFSVSEETTFAELHTIIQKSMGWNDEQAHQFRYGKGKSLTNVIGNTQEQVAAGDDFEDESDVTVASFIGRKRLPIRLLYRYDFFDDWTHELVVEEKVTEGGKLKFIGGERACPPEDCGGPFGYREALGGFAEWMDDDYDPEVFDPKGVKL
ncbi:plasmid pRiA4b ORF-3 family protein [Akkermansiaceae bacterium]|nr:plasmid pRiA4b ORF-3 family protein [Akkermansiaceae bacterium]